RLRASSSRVLVTPEKLRTVRGFARSLRSSTFTVLVDGGGAAAIESLSGPAARASPLLTICNLPVDASLGHAKRLMTFGWPGFVTSTTVTPSFEFALMYRYCLSPFSCRSIWLVRDPDRVKCATTVAGCSEGLAARCFASAPGVVAAKNAR